jgi:ABC-type molybdate transport system substrate-binding protein
VWSDDGDSNGSAGSGYRVASSATGGGVATVHTAADLEPVARELVDAYNETSDAPVELVVTPPNQAIKAISQGAPGIIGGSGLAGVDVHSVAIGRSLAIIAVPAGNPADVTGVEAFSPGSGLETAICGANTPVGNFAVLVLALGGVRLDPSRAAEGCGAEALASVGRGEVDAALACQSYVPVPENVEVVNIPDDQNIVIDIRYAPADDDPSADSFQGFLASDPAKQILSEQGFLP